MKLDPEIVTLPEATYVGLEAQFIIVLSPEANNLMIVPQLWRDFAARQNELGVDLSRCESFGLCQPPEHPAREGSRPDEALYLAAVKLPANGKIPPGMVAWTVPEATYARFIHRGALSKVGESYAAIYGEWIRADGRKRDKGPDIERYDDRFNPTGENSEFEIMVPLAQKK